MSSPDIFTDLERISLKKQHLEERRKILCIFQELRKRAEFGQTEEAAATQKEINDIDNELKELDGKKTELQRTYENILNDKKVQDGPELQPGSHHDVNVYYIELPPACPPPAVFLDVQNLPPHPCRTQCPECNQIVLTETSSSVSSVTWLACLISVMVGCVAGCCLVPFFSDKFKSITHHCPKCRSKIVTLKKL